MSPVGSVPIIRKDSHPDTLATKFGNAVAGAAIEDHFLDVVVPTLHQALTNHREAVLSEIDRAISSKVTDDIRPIVESSLEKIVREAVHKQSGGGTGLCIEIYDPTSKRTELLSRQHYMFPVLLRMLCIRDKNANPLNIAITGPAGNGKTSMALATAEALGIDPVLQPFTPQTTKSDLLGYMDASGKYVASPFYQAFVKGKIFIADEFDAANPSIAVTLNAAVANRMLTFPNLETVKAHPNFRAVFVMNTNGTGADHQYTGRMRQDAATLDRLVHLHVPIDKGLEAGIADVPQKSPKIDLLEGGRFEDNTEILEIVRSVRQVAQELDMKYIFSPRATLHATAMHAGGFGKKWIMDSCIWRGMNETDKKLIMGKANLSF
jgi:AAA domain (dynein-related subfamily)